MRFDCFTLFRRITSFHRPRIFLCGPCGLLEFPRSHLQQQSSSGYLLCHCCCGNMRERENPRKKNNVGPRSEHSLQVSCRSPLAIDVVWLSSSSRKIERGTRRWTRGCVGPSGKARSYLRPIKIPFFISDSSLMCDVPSFAENVHVRRESSLGKASICMPLRC